jgi:hypothetical protein
VLPTRGRVGEPIALMVSLPPSFLSNPVANCVNVPTKLVIIMFTRNVVTSGAIGSLEFRSGGLGVGDKVTDQAVEIQAVSATVCRLETTSGTMKPALCSCRRLAETLGCIGIEGALLHWDRLSRASADRKKLPGKKIIYLCQR